MFKKSISSRILLFFLCLFVITSFPLFAQGSTSKKPIETYKDGKLIKKKFLNYTDAKGDKSKKAIETYKDGKVIKRETYKDGKKIKTEMFDITHADGTKYKKVVLDQDDKIISKQR